MKEFLEQYVNLWEKRLENARGTENEKLAHFACHAVKKDMLFFTQE